MTNQEAADVLTGLYNHVVRTAEYSVSQGIKPDRTLAEALLVAIKAIKDNMNQLDIIGDEFQRRWQICSRVYKEQAEKGHTDLADFYQGKAAAYSEAMDFIERQKKTF